MMSISIVVQSHLLEHKANAQVLQLQRMPLASIK